MVAAAKEPGSKPPHPESGFRLHLVGRREPPGLTQSSVLNLSPLYRPADVFVEAKK